MATLSSFKVLVDRMRGGVQGGVIPSWLPRRLGGGLGQRKKGTQRFTWKVYTSPLAVFSAHISFRRTSRKGYMSSYMEGEMSEMKSSK